MQEHLFHFTKGYQLWQVIRYISTEAVELFTGATVKPDNLSYAPKCVFCYFGEVVEALVKLWRTC